jgi:argininosuccinate lyase
VTLWQARLSGAPDPTLLAFTESLSFDRALAPFDLEGSRAHVAGLEAAGLLDAEEAGALRRALDTVGAELRAGTFSPAPGDEDIHTAVERRVTELAGEVGARLHTGRSRNDQVATDQRLFVRAGLAEVSEGLVGLASTLLRRAEEAGDAYLPGYTHLQRAQPVPLAHHLLAHGWALLRDLERCLDVRRRTGVSPLGAGALAGSSLPLQPAVVAEALGLDRHFENSLDAVADRDFAAEALFVLALVGVHLSRQGEEIVLWSTTEFGFLGLDDAFATGSSMLPQKKNPDIAELARGKVGRLVGDLVAVLTTLKGLPLAYNRDLQEVTEPLLDATATVTKALAALAGLWGTARFELERMRAAADDPASAAVDLAEWLVARGMPFRRAHAVVASVVRRAGAEGIGLADAVASEPSLGAPALGILEAGAAVQRRRTPGGAGPAAVASQLDAFRSRLATLAEAAARA